MVMQALVPVSASQLRTFVDTPEQLLQQSEELQLAIASINNTPRSLLEILANSTFEQVAEAARLPINYAGEAGDNWQQLVDDILALRQLGQNDRLVVLLKLGAVPPSFISEWVPAEKLIQASHTIQMPLRYRLQLWERLAFEPTLEPRLQAAESLETLIAVLEQLAGDLDLPVRLAVSNPSSSPALIELVEGQYISLILFFLEKKIYRIDGAAMPCLLLASSRHFIWLPNFLASTKMKLSPLV